MARKGGCPVSDGWLCPIFTAWNGREDGVVALFPLLAASKKSGKVGVPVFVLSRHAHDLAGLGHIAEFLGQIQQSQLVLDDRLVYKIHAGLPLYGFVDCSHNHQTR